MRVQLPEAEGTAGVLHLRIEVGGACQTDRGSFKREILVGSSEAWSARGVYEVQVISLTGHASF